MGVGAFVTKCNGSPLTPHPKPAINSPAMTSLLVLVSSCLSLRLSSAGGCPRPSPLLINLFLDQWSDYQTLELRITPAVPRWDANLALPRASDQHIRNQIDAPSWVVHRSLNSAVHAPPALFLPRPPISVKGCTTSPIPQGEMWAAPGFLPLPHPHPLSIG